MHALKSLSDRELVSRLRTLVEKEKSLTLEIVSHLVEVARRGLHLGRGYGSLYDYCRGELGYSDASAWRRVRTAQAILRCPDAWERLVEGRVTLCTLARVQKFITPKVLEEICGKSQAEVELIAARYDAKGVSPDRMRPVMVPKAVKPAPVLTPAAACTCDRAVTDTKETDEGLRSEVCPWEQPDVRGHRGEVDISSEETLPPLRSEVASPDLETTPPLRSEVTSSGHENLPGLRSEVTASGQGTLTSLRSEVRDERGTRQEFEKKWKVEAVISDQVKAKLDRCKSLLSSKYPRGIDYDTLFSELSEAFLERMDPERKKERREKKKANRKHPGKAAVKTPAKESPSRHIPASVKEQVWTRDKGRCAYVGTHGKRCNSKFGLQIDHFPIPFARGGPSKASNLRLLCARHNRYTAEQTFGGLCPGRRAAPADSGNQRAPITHRRE